MDFNAGAVVTLEPDRDVRVSVDISARVQTIDSVADDSEAGSGVQKPIPPESMDMLNWDRIYLSLLEYKQSKGMDNLLISPESPPRRPGIRLS